MKKQMIFVLVMVLSLSFSNFVLAIDDPVAHWKLDEGVGMTAYDSEGDNDGNLVNGPLWTTGIINGALQFDGVDDYVALSNNAVTTTEFTIAAWANQYGLAGGVGDHDNKIFVQRDDSTGTGHSGIGLTTMASTGYAEASLRSSTSSTMVLKAERKPYGEWHHYAMTVDSANFRFYIDGDLVDSETNNQSGDYTTSIDHVYIGRLMYGGGLRGSFNGAIDEVIIYDRALSATEVEELYLGEEAELVGLEIAGPDEVPEDSQMQYSAIALYDNNSTVDVTDDALWSVEPNVIASIEAGLLATEKIFQPQELDIYAQYTKDGNTFEANKPVSVFAICPSGSALEFDGEDDYVSCGTGPTITGTGPLAVSAWVKTDRVKGHAIVVQRSESSANGSYGVSIRADGRAQFYVYNGGYGFLFQSDVTVDDGLWHHVAAVRTNSTDGEIYVDGSLSGSDSGPARSLNNVPVWIGGPGFTGPFVFDGLIDDVRIWNAAMTQEEIQATMHVALDGSEPNLVAYWDFDEGEGQVAYDTSGNGNDGQLGTRPDIDDSDPNWADSDAPVGICTLQELVERNVNNTLEIKLNILKEIEEALLMEDASVNILDGLFGDVEYGYLDKRDIRKARQEIHSAIQSEEQAIHSVEKSVDDLEDSLDVLTGEDGAE